MSKGALALFVLAGVFIIVTGFLRSINLENSSIGLIKTHCR